MKGRRIITIVVTFIAGLYFLLDFIVPPTMPGVSFQAVVADWKPGSVSVRSGTSAPILYQLISKNNLRPQLLSSQRDTLGKPKLTAILLREAGVGAKVTVRIGPFVAAHIINPQSVSLADRTQLSLSPGQKWVTGAGSDPIATPTTGQPMSIEQVDGIVVSKDPGSIDFISRSGRVTRSLGDHTAVIKLARNGPGGEVSVDDLKVGDTAQIGPATTFVDNRDTAAQFNTVITTMAFGIGLLSLGMTHTRILVQRKTGWYLSIFFFFAVAMGVIAGVGKYEDPGTAARATSDFFVLRVIASVNSAIFSLLAFYMAAAAYRAFRVKTAEAALMMTSALIVMLGQTPFGSYLTSWMGEQYSALWLPNIAGWILRVPNTSVFRGLTFGVMLGAIATALRYWFSMEKSVSGGE